MRHLFLLLPFFFLGCEKDPNFIETEQVKEAPATKWKIETQGYFHAGQDNNKREIIIMTAPDGKKFLAITGCGVTELHSKGSGDDRVTVEE